MTRAEFREWMTYHQAKFVALITWFDKIEKRHSQNDDVPSFEDTIASWFRTLRQYDLADATRATDIMGVDVPEPPSYERHRHPMVIGDICRKLRGEGQRVVGERQRRYVDGEEAYECALCQDGGIVIIWTVEAMRAARAGTPVRDVIYFECAVRCTCPRAAGWPPVFDPRVMLPFKRMPIVRSEEPADLLEFVVGRGAKFPEFDQHSGSGEF